MKGNIQVIILLTYKSNNPSFVHLYSISCSLPIWSLSIWSLSWADGPCPPFLMPGGCQGHHLHLLTAAPAFRLCWLVNCGCCGHPCRVWHTLGLWSSWARGEKGGKKESKKMAGGKGQSQLLLILPSLYYPQHHHYLRDRCSLPSHHSMPTTSVALKRFGNHVNAAPFCTHEGNVISFRLPHNIG